MRIDVERIIIAGLLVQTIELVKGDSWAIHLFAA